MHAPLAATVTTLLAQRDRWRKLHQQGDLEGVDRLLAEVNLDDVKIDRLRAFIPEREIVDAFDAYGREWERSLAVHGLESGAHLFATTLKIVPNEVVPFQTALEEKFATPEPWGALLFMQSCLPLELTRASWRACAYVLITPEFKGANLGLISLPGVVSVETERKVAGS